MSTVAIATPLAGSDCPRIPAILPTCLLPYVRRLLLRPLPAVLSYNFRRGTRIPPRRSNCFELQRYFVARHSELLSRVPLVRLTANPLLPRAHGAPPFPTI